MRPNMFRALPRHSVVNLAAFSQTTTAPRVVHMSAASLNSLLFQTQNASTGASSFSTSASNNASSNSSSGTPSAFAGSRSSAVTSSVLSNVPVALANGFMSEWSLSSLLLSKVDTSDDS